MESERRPLALRADSVNADRIPLPIIVITSFALSGDDQRANVAKPYSPRELLDVSRRLAPEA